MTTISRTIFSAVVAVAALALTGCTTTAPDDAGGPPSPTPSVTAESPSPTPTPDSAGLPGFELLQEQLRNYNAGANPPPTISFATLVPGGLPETFRDETEPSPAGTVILRVACAVLPGEGDSTVTIDYSSAEAEPAQFIAQCGESPERNGVVTFTSESPAIATGGVYEIVMTSEREAAVAVGFVAG